MKSVLKVEETDTIEILKRRESKAVEILRANDLPYAGYEFDTIESQLTVQKREVLEMMRISTSSSLVYDQSAHMDSIKQNLNDYDKALLISKMSETDFLYYQISGRSSIDLLVPETLVDERESVTQKMAIRVRKATTVIEMREILESNGEIVIPDIDGGKTSDNYDWFWKPNGDVMFAVEGENPIEIPCWPESIKDSTGASWSQEMTTYQHYEPKNTFKQSGPRVVSCTFKIHRAMWTGSQDSGHCEELVAYMESACYPDYRTQASEPPRCLLTVGGSVRIKGIMTSFDKTYQGPIGFDTKYDEVIINISITEESDNVLSTEAVRAGLAGWR